MFLFSLQNGIMASALMNILLHAGSKIVAAQSVDEDLLRQVPFFSLMLQSLNKSAQKHTPDGSEKIDVEYDYIIVGGGPAGSVVASRLSEESCIKVLLLEAGPKPPLITEVPGLKTHLLGSDVDWKFETVPQFHLAKGIKNKVPWNSGKMLGGSGTHNGMIYVRGNRKNYDDWAAQGAKGWSYEEVLPYFLKLEDNRDFRFVANGYHYVGGPITVEEPRLDLRLKNAFYGAAGELGYEFVDSNGPKQTGFYDYQMNIKNGQRCSTIKGYLVPTEHNPNLHILMKATVTKIIMKDKQAKGVVFYRNGQFQTVRARKEVIVSGGAVNTPKLLMLSGIGPKKELEKFNITVVVDLPVGKNLQDHPTSGYFFTVAPEFNTRRKLLENLSILEYTNYRSGPLSNAGKFLKGFLSSLNATVTADFPSYDLEIDEILKESVKSKLEPEVYAQYFGPIDESRTFFACSIRCLQPRSRGSVTLRSLNPFDPPAIDPKYLEDSKDLDDIVDGLKMCKKIVNTVSLQLLGAKPFHTLMPGCEDYGASDEDYFKCFARRLLTTGYHAVGTSKMGDSNDPLTVVDEELRVKGVTGLRVVDASVMPIIPSGNTHVPTVMVAEKASDIIKRSVKCFKRNY